MGLSEQERNCADVACRHLDEIIGGKWQIVPGQTLDDLYPRAPSPEVLISNGKRKAAIEVKRLTGDQVENEYRSYWLSLRKSLTPPCGGRFFLDPPFGFRLPADLRLMRLLKREIARVAPTLAIGETGAVRIPRHGDIQMIKPTGPGLFYCQHTDTSVSGYISGRLDGAFMLMDQGHDHSFVTEQGREDFARAIMAACATAASKHTAPVDWFEEWKLVRAKDGSESSVQVIAPTEAREVGYMVEAAVVSMLEKATQKFTGQRWADLHVVVFDSQHPYLTAETVTDAILAMLAIMPDSLAEIDYVLLVNGEAVDQVWQMEEAAPEA